MVDKTKAPFLPLILLVFSVGASAQNKVVVIPLGGQDKLGEITSVSNTSASTNPGVSAGVTATCLSGQAISGGFETANTGADSWEVKRLVRVENGWRVFGKNASGIASTITAFAYCLGD